MDGKPKHVYLNISFYIIYTFLLYNIQVVHSVHGIMFKDLKQILRKEQCDGSILLTANVPSTKKVVVHGPQGIILKYNNKYVINDHNILVRLLLICFIS